MTYRSSVLSLVRHMSVGVGVCLVLAACGPAATQQNADKPQPQPVMGKMTPEASAALVRTVENDLGQCEAKTKDTDAKLAEVIDKISGGKPDMSGKPMPPMPEVIQKLTKEKVTVTIDVLGSPQAPMLMVKDSFMEEGAKLQGAPPAKLQAYAKRALVIQPLTTALRDQVNSINAALGASLQSMMSCSMMAQALPTTLGAIENGGEQVPAEVFGAYAKMLQANARSKAVIAASLALVGVTQATVAGKDAKAFTTLVEGVKVLKDNPATVTEEQARAVYKAAGQSLIDQCQANLDKYYKDHPEAKKPDGPSPCSKEGLAADREKWNKGPNQGGADVPTAEVDESIRHLLPGTPLDDAAAAVQAIQKGDFVGGLRGALKMVGKNVPFGGVLDSVLSLF